MVKIDADFDWEKMTNGSLNSIKTEEDKPIEYRRTDIASIPYDDESAANTAKVVSKAYQYLSSQNRNPTISYSLDSPESFVAVPEKDVQFAIQKLPYSDGDRLNFSIFSDRPSNYSNPRYKAQFYSSFQEEMEEELDEIMSSLEAETMADKFWSKLRNF